MIQENDQKQYKTPAQAVKKSYLRQFVNDAERERFRNVLSVLLDDLDSREREDPNRDCVKTFLESSFWNPTHYKINKVNDTDLAITDKTVDKVCMMFECKRVGSDEMVRKEDLNRKGLHELILYYILEERVKKNTEIRKLAITDGYQYFVFDKGDFYRFFGSKEHFVRQILNEEYDDKTKRSFIYERIISPEVEKIWKKIPYTYFDLGIFEGRIKDADVINDRKFKAIYKFFTPTHLLNLPYAGDHNTLNERFYKELLYIMGLREVAESGIRKIVRIQEQKREPNSLFEQTFALLDDYTFDSLSQREETAMGLIMVWVNRILFLKLLESQLVRFNGGDTKFAFLNNIHDFNELHTLFFSVLAIPVDERSHEIAERFRNVPYLNSSLFELSDVERNYFSVNSLNNGNIKLMQGTVVKDHRGRVATGTRPLLDYILLFLDSFDFGSGNETEGKTIINASVLGLIFEKINGYRDGSFFTPGYITSYLCHNVIRETVLQKMNDTFHLHCKDFEDLKENFDYTNRENRAEANAVINSITICDPGVGSGHFLVSALNEMIAVKRDLNVLCYQNGERVRAYNINIEDDELIVSDENGEVDYHPEDVESNRLQTTLFEEKKDIIEHCLFGVDINPKSSEICQLRLWIELLKNAYYIKDSHGERQLQTLPNIDINIKTGNSLIMQQPLDANLNTVLAGAGLDIDEYRNDVAAYKLSATKANKHRMNRLIHSVKTKIHKGFSIKSPTYKEWTRTYSELLSKTNNLFPDDDQTKKLSALREKEHRLRKELDEMDESRILKEAFEWRYEFPEALDTNGNFIGFDIVIGNPPYGVQMNAEYRQRCEKCWKHVPDYEIYYYFIELAHAILKKDGIAAYIIPNTWLFNVNAFGFRKEFLRQWDFEEILDCSAFPIFDKATVRNSVITMRKHAEGSDCHMVGYRNTRGIVEEAKEEDGKNPFKILTKRPLLHINTSELENDFAQNWALAFKLTEIEKNIVVHIESNTSKISDFFDVSQGFIPYRFKDLKKSLGAEEAKRIMEGRLWHSDHKVDDSYIQEIKGENISKYGYKATGEFVKYGKHVGTYVDMKFFSSPRLLVREILNPLIACYIEDTYVNDPQIIDIICKTNTEKEALKYLWAILNSKLAYFFVIRNSPKATKGVFPKILISDIKNFPLPALETQEKKDLANALEEKVVELTDGKRKGTADDNKVRSLEKEIDILVCELYGMDKKETDYILENT